MKRPPRSAFLVAALSVFGACGGVMCSGCVAVKPYQREWLALPGMSLDPEADRDSAVEQHVLESREGSAGGYGSVGGGCGCN